MSSTSSDLALGFGIIGAIVVLAAVSVGLCCYLWGRKRRRDAALGGEGHRDDIPLRSWQLSTLPIAQPPVASGISLGLSRSVFKYEELVEATDGFSVENILGQGGFGYVYKGVLSDGLEVAIKQLKAESKQGDREFQAEVEIISRIHHRNLVLLFGYCISGAERMLVYEFIPNKTLEFHLHGKGRPVMSWATRMRTAVGSARGLAYLHEDCRPKIIHRDIKSANILLNNKFEAKVADFGLAKFSSDGETHITTRVMGTFGYLAPEYAASGQLTVESDIYSFGMVLLELLTGHRPQDMIQNTTMVSWAKPLLTQALEDGNFQNIVDPMLQNDYNSTEIARVIACTAACLHESARRRPRMSQIVRALEGSIPLNQLTEPGELSNYYRYESSESDGEHDNEMISGNITSESQGQTTGENSLYTGSSNETQRTQISEQMGEARGSTATYPHLSFSSGAQGLVLNHAEAR